MAILAALRTMVLPGVATGSMKAKPQQVVAGMSRCSGWTFSARVCMMDGKRRETRRRIVKRGEVDEKGTVILAMALGRCIVCVCVCVTGRHADRQTGTGETMANKHTDKRLMTAAINSLN